MMSLNEPLTFMLIILLMIVIYLTFRISTGGPLFSNDKGEIVGITKSMVGIGLSINAVIHHIHGNFQSHAFDNLIGIFTEILILPTSNYYFSYCAMSVRSTTDIFDNK